jgi:hypothetical protein
MTSSAQKPFGKLLDVLLPAVAVVASLMALALVAGVVWLVHSLPAPGRSTALARLPQPLSPAAPAAIEPRLPAARAPHPEAAPPPHVRAPLRREPPPAPVAQAAVGGPRPPEDLTGDNSDRAKNRALGQALSHLGGEPGAARRLGLPP